MTSSRRLQSRAFATVAQSGHSVIVRLDKTPRQMKDITDYLHDMRLIYEKKEQFMVLYDCLGLDVLEKKYIDVQVQFMRDQAEKTKNLMVCAAIVVNNLVLRGIIRTMFVVQPPACPIHICSTIDEASQILRSYNCTNKNKCGNFRILNDAKGSAYCQECAHTSGAG